MITVVGVDPGGVTGWCVARADPGKAVAAGQPGSVLQALTGMWLGQIGGPEVDHVDAVLAAALGPRRAVMEQWHATTVIDDGISSPLGAWYVATHVVVEAFNLRVGLNRGAASKRETISPVRVSFGIEYGLHRLGWDGMLDTTRQGPADAKAVITDTRLREWGLFVGGKDKHRHQRDAQRHALLLMKKLLSQRER